MSLCPVRIHMLKPNPQCDGFWERVDHESGACKNLISILTKRDSRALSPPPPYEDLVRTAIVHPGSKLLLDPKDRLALILDFSDLKTGKMFVV